MQGALPGRGPSVMVWFLFSLAAAAALAGGVAAIAIVMWYLYPLYRRRR